VRSIKKDSRSLQLRGSNLNANYKTFSQHEEEKK